MTDIIETLPEVAPETVTLAPEDQIEIVGFVQDKADEEVIEPATVI
jgi:hypothetical protein